MVEFRTEFKSINSKQILIDEEYQRQVDYLRVRKMVANYNPNLVNPIKVSFRNNKYYCFDGQHTLSMLKALNENKDLPVQCKVYYGMQEEDEARLFSEQNGLARAVQSNQKLKSLYVAGDVDVIEFKNAVEEVGIKCDFLNNGCDKKLICYSTAFKIYMKNGKKHLQRILRIIIAAWDGSKDALQKEIITGLDVFVKTYEDEFDENYLVKHLMKTSPIALKREGNDVLTGGSKKFAIPIFNCYNKGKNNKLAYKF